MHYSPAGSIVMTLCARKLLAPQGLSARTSRSFSFGEMLSATCRDDTSVYGTLCVVCKRLLASLLGNKQFPGIARRENDDIALLASRVGREGENQRFFDASLFFNATKINRSENENRSSLILLNCYRASARRIYSSGDRTRG